MSTTTKAEELAAEQAAGGGEAVGKAAHMPGTTGFTMCAFEAAKVPEGTYLYTHPAPAAPSDPQPKGVTPDVDQLAQYIRQIDGRNDMGAGTLAEKIVEWLASAPAQSPAVPVQPVGELPLGAIENGRAYAARLEREYQFDCEVGPLANCTDWQDLLRCFEHLAEHALSTRPELGDAEIDALRSDLAGYVKVSSELATENEALRRDAERYRAVRDDDCHPYAICIWDEDDGWAQDARKPDVVDAAIDAALAAARGEKR